MTVQDVDNAFRKKANASVKLFGLRKKIENGTATMEDAAQYQTMLSKILGQTIGESILNILESERVKFLDWILRNQYQEANDRLAVIQQFLDKQQGIQIAPQKAPFPAERVEKLGKSLTDPTVPDYTIQRRAKAGTETVTKSFHDDYVKTTAKFRSRAGLKCFITRKAVSGCCAWCTKMAGRYEYGSEPDDVYRRHDNCDCTLTFENGRKRQDVWSKREWEAPKEDAGAGDPVVLTKEQAAALQAEKGLTILPRNGTMKSNGTGADEGQHWFEKITTIDPSDKKAAAQLLRDFERQYADSQIEHCRVVTAAGEVYDVHGGRWTVDTTLLGERMRGSTNEHNHVTGESQYSFSWEDLKSSAEDGSKVAIAFDEKYRYTMIFPDFQLDDDTLYAAYQAAHESVGDDLIFYPEKIAKGDEQHEAIKRACKTLGIQYGRTRISG